VRAGPIGQQIYSRCMPFLEQFAGQMMFLQ